MSNTGSMRRDWDARAAKDAFYYIASWRKDWDVSGFFASGEEDYGRLVAPTLDHLGFSSAGKSMLELGCGAGRMTRAFATHFGHVAAVDVSAQMLDRAKRLLPEMANVSWLQVNGADLNGVPSESVDFAFSYLVLQHLPDERLVCAYVREMLRVLRPGGICLFQFHGTKQPTMNWKGRAAWEALDILSTIGLRPAARLSARLLGLDPEMAGKNWHGVAIAAETISKTVKGCKGQVLEMHGEGTPMAWCCATRPGA